MFEDALYQGAQAQAAPTAQNPLPDNVAGAALQQGLQQAAQGMAGWVHAGMELEDSTREMEDSRRLLQIEEAAGREVKRRLELPDGADGSFFDHRHELRAAEQKSFVEGLERQFAGIGQGIADPVRSRQTQAKAGMAQLRLAGRMFDAWDEVARQKRKQAFDDCFDLAVAQGNYGEAVSVVGKAVEDGIVSRERGEVMKLKLAKSQARAQGAEARAVNLGGVEYGGSSAALAAQAMRDGSFAAFSDEDDDTAAGGDGEAGDGSGDLPLTLGGASGLLEEVEPVRADVTRVGIAKTPDEKKGEPVTLGGAVDLSPEAGETAGGEDPLAAAGDGLVSIKEAALVTSPADAWFLDGDMSGLCRVMPQSEFASWQDVLSFDGAITLLERSDGGVDFTCAPTAPEAVQRTAAHAQQIGEIGEDDAKAMVARMTMDALEANPQESTEHLVEMYKDSGLYQAFGQGDAEVGKVRLRAVVEEYAQRMQAGSGKLQMKAVERMVDARLAEPDFGKGREWKVMEGLNPRVEKGEKWDKSEQDETGRKRWFALFEVYKRYRDEFNPLHKEGEADKKEFEPLAQDFYDWYMGRSHKYKDMKKRDTEAARDWFLAHVAEGLRDKMQVGEDGGAAYQGYAADVEVARERLKDTAPFDLGQDALAELEVRRQQADAKRSAMFRKRAEKDYVRLREMKQAFQENSEKAQREKKRAEEKERREREKSEEQERKVQEKLASRKLAVARRQPRQQAWAWDRKPSADGESPACTVPEEEYRRLVEELGWDGSQDVYLRVAGASIQVVGANRRKRLELNAPAVLKVQKRPNTKRGEKWKLQGDLGYSYIFRTYAN